ncbi:MAG: hypothetical protein ABI613_03480 [Gemmatimonadota bacterium]
MAVSGGAVARNAGSQRTPWVIAAVAGACILGLLLVVLAKREPQAQTASAGEAPFASSGAGTPPDISNMSPRERFDRLYNKVMAAAESGDMATVNQFTPMAVLAYGQLDTIDTDARFHLALLSLHTGDPKAVEALADTILQQTPGHLFAFMIRGAAARFAKDDAGLKQAYTDFLNHYDAEMKAGRPEYTDHKRSVDDFHTHAAEAKT